MKRLMLSCGAALWLCLATISACSADDPPSFAFEREILLKPVEQNELVTVLLDGDVFACTNDDLFDIAVVNDDGIAVPFLVSKDFPASVERQHTWTAKDITLQPLESNGLDIRLRLDEKDPLPMSIRLITPLQNFEQAVQVFAIIDGAESPLVRNALIFDYSQFMDIRRTEIHLPETRAREFRLVIETPSLEVEAELIELTRTLQGDVEKNRTERKLIQRRPFRIDRIEFNFEPALKQDPGSEWPVFDFQVAQDSERKWTTVEFKTRREPLTSIHCNFEDTNFSRRIRLQVPESAQFDTASESEIRWHDIASGLISRFQLQGLNEERLEISFAELRSERLRLVVENRDSPALKFENLTAYGNNYSLSFLAAPASTYNLLYSADTNHPAQHDTAAVTTAFSHGIQPMLATLGPPSRRQQQATSGTNFKTLVNSPVVLSFVVGLLILVLGFALYQASMRVSQTTDETRD